MHDICSVLLLSFMVFILSVCVCRFGSGLHCELRFDVRVRACTAFCLGVCVAYTLNVLWYGRAIVASCVLSSKSIVSFPT